MYDDRHRQTHTDRQTDIGTCVAQLVAGSDRGDGTPESPATTHQKGATYKGRTAGKPCKPHTAPTRGGGKPESPATRTEKRQPRGADRREPCIPHTTKERQAHDRQKAKHELLDPRFTLFNPVVLIDRILKQMGGSESPSGPWPDKDARVRWSQKKRKNF